MQYAAAPHCNGGAYASASATILPTQTHCVATNDCTLPVYTHFNQSQQQQQQQYWPQQTQLDYYNPVCAELAPDGSAANWRASATESMATSLLHSSSSSSTSSSSSESSLASSAALPVAGRLLSADSNQRTDEQLAVCLQGTCKSEQIAATRSISHAGNNNNSGDNTVKSVPLTGSRQICGVDLRYSNCANGASTTERASSAVSHLNANVNRLIGIKKGNLCPSDSMIALEQSQAIQCYRNRSRRSIDFMAYSTTATPMSKASNGDDDDQCKPPKQSKEGDDRNGEREIASGGEQQQQMIALYTSGRPQSDVAGESGKRHAPFAVAHGPQMRHESNNGPQQTVASANGFTPMELIEYASEPHATMLCPSLQLRATGNSCDDQRLSNGSSEWPSGNHKGANSSNKVPDNNRAMHYALATEHFGGSNRQHHFSGDNNSCGQNSASSQTKGFHASDRLVGANEMGAYASAESTTCYRANQLQAGGCNPMQQIIGHPMNGPTSSVQLSSSELQQAFNGPGGYNHLIDYAAASSQAAQVRTGAVDCSDCSNNNATGNNNSNGQHLSQADSYLAAESKQHYTANSVGASYATLGCTASTLSPSALDSHAHNGAHLSSSHFPITY